MKTQGHIGAKTRGTALMAMLVACAGFAAWPLGATRVAPAVIAQPEAATKQLASLDLAAFRVPLWVAEPAPPPPPPPATPTPLPPPLKLQLLAIIREGENYKAAVYDPDSDRILVVTAGERIGARTVDKVDKTTLTLRDGTGNRVLALKVGEEGS